MVNYYIVNMYDTSLEKTLYSNYLDVVVLFYGSKLNQRRFDTFMTFLTHFNLKNKVFDYHKQ